MKKLLAGLLALFCLSAQAQFTPGQLLTAQTLNAQFAHYLPIVGGTLTGPLTVPMLTTANAQITGGSVKANTVNGVLNAAICSGGSSAAAWCSGSDIGAWVNAAFAACSNKCTVYVPAGTYSSSTTIEYPVATNGTAALRFDPGATLNYTGSGWAIEANGAGNASANVDIEVGTITGTSAGLGGIHLKAFNKGQVKSTSISGFTNGDAILNEGDNSVDIFAPNLSGNKNGVRNVGVVVGGNNYSANAIHVYGGMIASNTNWGWIEDGINAGTVGPNENNVANGVVFENNGTNGNSATGQIFNQQCDSCSFEHNYLEYFAGSTKTNSIQVGDASHKSNATTIRANWLGSTGATNSISNVNSDGLSVVDNIEAGSPTNFFLQGTASRHTFIGKNEAYSATNYLAGVDNGDTVVMGLGGTVTWINASGGTPNGYGFNQIAGLNQDLVIRSRSGATNTVQFMNAAGSPTSAIDDAGEFTGNVMVKSQGVENFANNAMGYTFFSGSVVIRAASSSGSILMQDGAGGYTAPTTMGSLTANGSISATTTGTMPLYSTTGVGVNAPHMVQGSVALSSGSATVTLSGSAVYTSSSSYACTANDTTAANAVKVGQTSGTSITFTGTSTDIVQFLCAGS